MTLEQLIALPRVTVRAGGGPDPDGRCVVYWMQRAQRAHDNPALDVAIDAANELGQPCVVFLGLVPFYPHANWRHYQFLVEGLRELGPALRARGVGFVLRVHPQHRLERFVQDVRASLVVGDENPLREPERWRQTVAARLRVPLWTVDADVVVPSKLIGKEQFNARTIRPRIGRLLQQFLIPSLEPQARRAWRMPGGLERRDPREELLDGLPIDRSVAPVRGIPGGARAGREALHRFIAERLAGYDEQRRHPEVAGTSQLSPYLHFGQLGPIEIALAVRDAAAPRVDREALLEELIVRRELAVNFVRYNPRYDQVASSEPWALRSLALHARDRRPIRLSESQLEAGESPDPLWNAAQRQMVTDGWMHGYLRMYWGKKILEWTRSPDEAFAIAVRLNDRYELDGRDPNGYAGIAWAVGGKHDRAFGERPIFGKIRYMSFASTSRKFDSRRFIASHKEPSDALV